MAADVTTIQSLKAVDAWIDVINANINGGVRTAFKTSRLKFTGSNTDLQRAGSSTNLPLQFAEPGLETANTVIDFSQGAITASTENAHLAIQGSGFFLLINPQCIAANGTLNDPNTVSTVDFVLTRDGEFHSDQNGLLVNSFGYYLVSTQTDAVGTPMYNNASGWFGVGMSMRAIYNDLDNPNTATAPQRAIRLSDFVGQALKPGKDISGAAVFTNTLMNPLLGEQDLQYSRFGSTAFTFGYSYSKTTGTATYATNRITLVDTTGTVLTKSLEASNASMTQSVPELSLAQKLFSALTKILQTKQTNTDSVINLIR